MDSNNMYQNNNGYQGQDGYGYQQDGYQNQNGYGYQQEAYQNQNAYAYQQEAYQNQNGYQYNNMYSNNFVQQDQPISMWGYLGYQLLFALPCIGFIFVLVFSFAGKSIHLKNFARSYLCFLLIVTVLGFIVSAVFGAGLMALMSEFRYAF